MKLGRVAKIRAKGCKAALKLYENEHRPDFSNWDLRCQIGGEMVDPSVLTPAHKNNRSQTPPGTELGQGEHPSNIWAACWPHHREVDLRPLLKKELMKQKVSCLDGGVLVLTKEQKALLKVKA